MTRVASSVGRDEQEKRVRLGKEKQQQVQTVSLMHVCI